MRREPAWTLLTPPDPSLKVVDLATAKAHCRIDADDTEYDTLLPVYISTATSDVQKRLGLSLFTQSWRASFPRSDCDDRFVIDRGPSPTVTQLQALVSGAYQVIDPTLYVVRPLPGADLLSIRRAPNSAWPSPDRDDAAWLVDVSVGWANSADVPAPIVQAALLLIGDMFSNRDANFISNLTPNPLVDDLLAEFRAFPI